MGWATSVTNLTLKVGGSTVGDSSGSTNKTILAASFGSGRSDWFASLSPGSASFTLLGDLTGSIDPGASLELLRGTDKLWTGKVDSVTLNEAAGQPDTTTVTGADFVAQLGEAQLKAYTIAEDDLEVQVEDVLSQVGFTATVSSALATEIPTTRVRTSYTGSVLDWLNEAEREANSITAVMPSGEIVLAHRGPLPDYGQRILDFPIPGLATPDSVWRMGTASGNLNDSSGTADLTASGTPSYQVNGPWGATGPKAIFFTKADAADQFVGPDDFDLADVFTNKFTIAGWLYWDGSSASDSPILTKQAAGPSGWQLRVTTDGRLHFSATNAGSTVLSVQSAAGAIPVSTWTHFAVVRSLTQAWTVINGVFGTGATLTGTIPNTAAVLRMGSDGGSLWYGGALCMVAIWKTSALSTELGTIYDLDKVDLPTPMTWTRSRSITSVINHWLIVAATYTDAPSVASYGRRTWDVSAASDDFYSAELLDIMANPRPIITATFSVTSTSSVLITIAPLDLALYDGTLYQVLDVRHDLDPSEWRVTLILDRTQNDISNEVPILPV